MLEAVLRRSIAAEYRRPEMAGRYRANGLYSASKANKMPCHRLDYAGRFRAQKKMSPGHDRMLFSRANIDISDSMNKRRNVYLH